MSISEEGQYLSLKHHDTCQDSDCNDLVPQCLTPSQAHSHCMFLQNQRFREVSVSLRGMTSVQ